MKKQYLLFILILFATVDLRAQNYINTITGGSAFGFSGDGGNAVNALFQFPQGVAVDASGNVYIADAGNYRVRKINSSGVISTIAGNGTPGFNGDGALAINAEIIAAGVALDASGNIYINNNFKIRKIDVATGIITTVAGNGIPGHSGDGGLATSAEFDFAAGFAVDSSGNIYIAEYNYFVIRKVDASTGIISTYAGNGTLGFSGNGGQATSAQLGYLNAVAVDRSGNLFIAAQDNTIRKVNSSGVITNFVGPGMLGGDPRGVATDEAGNLFIADPNSNLVRKVTPAGVITNYAGNGIAGFNGDGGIAINAQLNVPNRVAVDASGNVYIVDYANFKIRKVGPASAGAIVKAEYFIDNDPGIGGGINIPVIVGDTAIVTNYNIPVTGLSAGVHILFVRTKNTFNIWSVTDQRTFYIDGSVGSYANNTKIEYFIDNDPGVGGGTSIPVAAADTLTLANFSIPLAGITSGTHNLYVRAKTNNNLWNVIEQRSFYIEGNASGSNTVTEITKLEYFFDTDPGVGNATNWDISGLTPNDTVAFTNANKPVPCLSNGQHFMFLRAKNNLGVWSVTDYDTITVGGSITATVITANGPSTFCAGGNVVLSTPAATGIVYQWFNNGDTIPGQTTSSITVTTAGSYTLKVSCSGAPVASNAITVVTNTPTTWYKDLDGDMFGDKNTTLAACSAPATYISDSTDCNDSNATIHPSATELCNGIDDNCDGSIDNGNPGGGAACSSGLTGRCAAGHTVCQGGVLICVQDNQPISEACNGIDDNCDGLIDNGDPGGGATCSTGLFGRCATGHTVCQGGVVVCVQDFQSIAEVCNGIDDNCDGIIDNGNPGGGVACNTGLSGACAAGHTVCQSGALACVQDNSTRYFTFTGNSNFTNTIVNPALGTPYTNFHIEVKYVDLNGTLPAVNFPRLQMDYAGNGYSPTDPDDRIYLMSEDNPGDTDPTNGKIYSININGLAAGLNWTARIVASDGLTCTTNFGPFNIPDVKEAPNLVIFANDININPVHPTTNQNNVTVSATVHNASDYDAENFYVHLINQYDSSNFFYPDILISNLPKRASTTVTWNILTPPVPAWVPMEVFVDETDVIAETNELDNRAVRPFLNGNFNLPGGIICDAIVSPFASHSSASNYPVISGNVHYYGLAIPLADSSVAGATVTFTIVETGSIFTCYTGSHGYYSCPFLGPINIGIYHINVSITDYTLTGTCTTTFEILPSLLKPDLTTSVTVGYTGGVPGNSVSASITVSNSGTANAPASILDIANYGGTAAISHISVGALLVGQSATYAYGPVSTASPATVTICATADATSLVDEQSESNNTKCESIHSYGSSGGGGGGGSGNLGSSGFGGGGGGYVCNATYFSITLNNSGTVATGSFVVEVLISKNGVLQTTLTQTISGIAALSNSYATFQYNYAANGSGNYTYTVNCDINNDVVESNEGNNTSFYSNTLLPCKPNLLFAYCDSINDALTPNVIPGDTLTLTGNVQNTGKISTVTPITVRFNYSNGGIYDAIYNGNIPVGATVPVSVSAPVPPIGTTVFATIDPINQISEENEGDNVSPLWNLCYDFRIDTLCNSASNMWGHNYNLFETLNIRVGLSNLGLLSATNVKVRFQISGPGIIGQLTLGDAIVPSIGKLCKCPTEAFLPNGFVFTLNGLYTITVTADPDHLFTECNENNNVKVIILQVSDLPEYRILSQYINPSLLNPDVGQSVSVNITYENVGREDLNDSMRLNFLADNVPLNSIYPVPGLPKNNHATRVIPQWSSNVPGIHLLRAVIDADSMVNESNENNNEGTRSIVVGQSANLFFASFTPTNFTPALFQTISINTTIGNSGDLPCEADVQYYYTIGTDTLPISSLQHVNVPANSNVTLPPFDWVVSRTSTRLIGKIINSASLEYTYDDNITSVQIGAFNLSIATVPETCPNAVNGTATASATGGSAPYSYLWSNGSAGAILTATGGTYTLTVTDNSSQSVTGTATITTTGTAPASSILTGGPVLCAGDVLTAITTATSPVYQWKLNGVNINGATSSVYAPVTSGSYKVVVTDNALPGSCPSISPVVNEIVNNCNTTLNLKVFIEGSYSGNRIMIAIADPVNHPELCDTLTVELHNDSMPYVLAYQVKGTISTDGIGNFLFPPIEPGNSYYIVIRHRNSIETWSKIPVLFDGNYIHFDFTVE